MQNDADPPAGLVALIIVLLGGFLVWLCTQMSIQGNGTLLALLGAGLGLGLLALGAGSWRPQRLLGRRRRARREPAARTVAGRDREPARAR